MEVKPFTRSKDAAARKQRSPFSLFPFPFSFQKRNRTFSFFLFPSSFKEFQNGFTVLELLVASLLLTMLVTVLTMIFNQSSIAWRTGVAGVVELNTVRATMGAYHDMEDDALPGLGQTAGQAGAGASDSRDVLYRTVSVFAGWDGSGQLKPNDADRTDSNCRGRLYDKLDSKESASSMFQIGDVRIGRNRNLGSGSPPGGSAFAVGVRSAGPDKQWNTEDDINTFPEEVN